MQSLVNLQGWQLFVTCLAIGIIIAGLIVSFGVFIDSARQLGDRRKEMSDD